MYLHIIIASRKQIKTGYGYTYTITMDYDPSTLSDDIDEALYRHSPLTDGDIVDIRVTRSITLGSIGL